MWIYDSCYSMNVSLSHTQFSIAIKNQRDSKVQGKKIQVLESKEISFSTVLDSQQMPHDCQVS